MKYNFTTAPNRKGTGSSKWEQMYGWNPDVAEDVVPLSVADMELYNAPEIIDGLKNYLDDCVLGYTMAYPNYKEAVKGWLDRRHNFKVEDDWIVQTPGVVNAFTAAIRAYVKEGEGVIINRPIYYPMGIAIENSNVKEVNVPLLNNEGVYSIDFEGLEAACKDENNKVLLWCSPHNPTGRVWTKEELEKVGKICVENDVIIISDEIWNDLIMPGYKHTVLATISDEIKDITITCTAPSKTFNLAGLATSNIIISNEELREKFKNQLLLMRSSSVNILGFKACEIAYNECEDWLAELIELLEENRKMCHEFFDKRGMKITRTEGTYLVWVDFSSLGMDKDELEEFMHKKAEFFTDEGYVFGEEGDLYERLNIALPTEVLKIQLEKLGKALDSLK